LTGRFLVTKEKAIVRGAGWPFLASRAHFFAIGLYVIKELIGKELTMGFGGRMIDTPSFIMSLFSREYLMESLITKIMFFGELGDILNGIIGSPIWSEKPDCGRTPTNPLKMSSGRYSGLLIILLFPLLPIRRIFKPPSVMMALSDFDL